MKKNTYTHLLCRCAGMLLLMLYAPWVLAQNNITVSGQVTSQENNSALPGVNIVVKGTTAGTTSDADGRYTISAPENSTLVFSFIGFVNEEVPIGNRTTLNVSLVPDIEALSEVVVVAYGEKSRKLLTESIGTVDNKEIQRLPVASADAAIQGRVSGVQITSVSGTPGSPVSIRIRGVGTVGNAQPLFVIDGIPLGNPSADDTNPLAAINPADIDNISVLKDASAAALYGVRAANGVVLITTKRGKSGKPTITFDAYKGIQNFPNNRLLEWNNTEQYINLASEAIQNANAQDGLNPGDDDYRVLNPDLADPNSPLRNINTDWQREILLKNAPISNYNLSIGGGTEAATYNVSAGYFDQSAVIPRWKLSRYNFRINSDYKIGQRLRVGQNLSLSYQQVNRGSNAGGDGFILASGSNMPPFFQIYADPNNPIGVNRYGYNGNYLANGSGVAGITVGNPLALNALNDNYDHRVQLLGGLFAELEIIKGLKFRSAASIDFNSNRSTSWHPDYTLQEAGLARVSEAGDSRGEDYTQVFTNTLTYDRTFGEHSFNALAGFEYQKLRGTGLNYGSSNYLSNSPGFYVVVGRGQGPDAGFNNADGYASNMAYVGYLGRLSYDYKQKYLLTASFRRDGTASFAPELRYGNFPAVSAAWRITEEPFFNVPFISDLKLRGSWGQMGNSNIDPAFGYIAGVTTNPNYGLGRPNRSVQVAAPLPGLLVNRDLTWETVETTDFGFDVSFFNNKLSLLATYYFRNTKDFLFGLPIPRTAGYANQSAGQASTDPPKLPVNLGRVTNEGIELELGYQGNLTKDLTINVSGNLTTVKNRLAELYPNIQEYSTGDYRTAVGYPIGYFYGYRMLGVYQTDDEAAAGLVDNMASNRPRAGDVIFEDNNSLATVEQRRQGQQFSGIPNDTITAADRTYLGKTIPDFYYGINVGLGFKGFDLSALFTGVSGVQLYNQFRRDNEGLGGGGRNNLATTQNRWTGPGTSNTMPRAISGDPYDNNRFSSRWIEDAGFFRMRNIQLGYTLPKALLAKTKVLSNVRFYVAGSNLFIITNYTGLDPEVQTYNESENQLRSGTDQGNMPQPRTFQGGVQVQF